MADCKTCGGSGILIWSQILSLSIQRCDDCKKFDGDVSAAVEGFDLCVISQKPIFKITAQDYNLKPAFRIIKGRKQWKLVKK